MPMFERLNHGYSGLQVETACTAEGSIRLRPDGLVGWGILFAPVFSLGRATHHFFKKRRESCGHARVCTAAVVTSESTHVDLVCTSCHARPFGALMRLVCPPQAGAAIRCLVEAVQHMYCGKLNRVWRGLALTKNQITEYRKNSMIQWQAFTSTSLSEREAEHFARGSAHELKHPVLFEIRRDPKRATAARIDDLVAEDYASEKEVLMIPGCRFEVGGVTNDGDLTRVTLFERENAYEEMGWM